MWKKFLLFFLLSLLLYSSSIESKIKAKKKALHSTKIEYNKMDKKLSALAEKIIDAKAQRNQLEKRLSVLERSIEKNQAKYEALRVKKRDLNKQLQALNQEIEGKKEEFINLVADKFSMALVLEEIKKPTPESVMLQEAYGVYAKENEQSIKSLEVEISELKKREDHLIKEQSKVKEALYKYKKDREEYAIKKEEKSALIKRLARDKAIYKKRFDRIRAEQRSLRKKLAKLKIIQREQEEDQGSSKKHRPKKRVSTYHGNKTISPLKGGRLIKKYGTYIDPIYKFKIFNKSITLKAPYKGAKVKSVLSGKVVFAENSGGMLGRVVIIEHDNNLHTIYAKLSRLSPAIHVGKYLQKGAVIGKVDKSLMFEVTKNNKHINPLDLIQL